MHLYLQCHFSPSGSHGTGYLRLSSFCHQLFWIFLRLICKWFRRIVLFKGLYGLFFMIHEVQISGNSVQYLIANLFCLPFLVNIFPVQGYKRRRNHVLFFRWTCNAQVSSIGLDLFADKAIILISVICPLSIP